MLYTAVRVRRLARARTLTLVVAALRSRRSRAGRAHSSAARPPARRRLPRVLGSRRGGAGRSDGEEGGEENVGIVGRYVPADAPRGVRRAAVDRPGAPRVGSLARRASRPRVNARPRPSTVGARSSRACCHPAASPSAPAPTTHRPERARIIIVALTVAPPRASPPASSSRWSPRAATGSPTRPRSASTSSTARTPRSSRCALPPSGPRARARERRDAGSRAHPAPNRSRIRRSTNYSPRTLGARRFVPSRVLPSACSPSFLALEPPAPSASPPPPPRPDRSRRCRTTRSPASRGTRGTTTCSPCAPTTTSSTCTTSRRARRGST